MSVLILAVWATVFFAVLGSARPAREAALAAFTAITVLVLAITEALSLFRAITPLWLALSWAIALCILAVVPRRRVRAGLSRLLAISKGPWDRWDVTAAVVLGCFAIGTLLAALLYPTTNYDSWTYHMPRILFWAQNHSVAHYPTADGRQLFSSALVEYFALNLQLLSFGTDRLASLAQWFSYVFSLTAVSLLAGRLGATRRGQQVAAVVAASVPMAALQASTTQNDLTCALWCITAILCIVSFVGEANWVPPADSPSRWWLLWAATAAALAVQSKQTAYLVLPSFFVWLVVVAAKRSGVRRALGALTLIAVCFLVLNSAWFARNAVSLHGDFIGASAPNMGTILTKARDASRLTTTSLKNAAMLAATPSDELNGPLVGLVSAIARSYGGSVDDALTRDPYAGPYSLPASIRSHDYASAPLTVVLVVLSVAAILLLLKPRVPSVRVFMTCGGVAFVSVAGLIAWNFYTSRVLLGPLLVLVPLVGVAFSVLQARPGRLARTAFSVILVLTVGTGYFALCFGLNNQLLPLPKWTGQLDGVGYWTVPYEQLRFRVFGEGFAGVSDTIANAASEHGIDRIGIDEPTIGFPVYPLLTALSGRELGYVRHTVLPGQIRAPGFAPQAVLEIVPASAYPQVLEDGFPRGEMIASPQRITEWMVLFWRTP